jgi:hypothetical protein
VSTFVFGALSLKPSYLIHEEMSKNHVSWTALTEAIQANPNKTVQIGGGPASASLLALPGDTDVPWLPGWSHDTNQVLDVIAASLWIREPLYRSATTSVKQTMEMEEATFLMNQIEAAYKIFTGHTWVRKHLEEDLRLRSGGSPAAPDFWASMRTTKRLSQLVDYVCRLRGFRLCLFYPEQNEVTNVPLLSHGLTAVTLVDTEAGRVLLGASCTLQTAIIRSEMTWFVPLSESSIGATTMAQIVQSLQSLEPGVYKGNRPTLWRLLKLKQTQ